MRRSLLGACALLPILAQAAPARADGPDAGVRFTLATTFRLAQPADHDNVFFGTGMGAGATLMMSAPNVLGPVRVGLAFGGEKALWAPSPADYLVFRNGVAAGIGAPWDHSVVGIGIEAGVAAIEEFEPNRYSRTNGVGGVGYGQVALFVQVPLAWRVRPFLSPSVYVLSNPALPQLVGAIDIGLAWDLTAPVDSVPPYPVQVAPAPSTHDDAAGQFAAAVMVHVAHPANSGGSSFGSGVGVGALLLASVPRVLGPVHVGFALAGDHGFSSGADNEYTFLRAGGAVGIGAPCDRNAIFGFGVEAGLAETRAAVYPIPTRPTGTGSTLAEYGQAAVYVQWPRSSGSVRPFLAPFVYAFTGDVAPKLVAGADLGLTWSGP